ncbi:MAG: protein kinase, partial [Planctomycetota bacterium]
MPDQFANVFVSLPPHVEPTKWEQLFRQIPAPSGLTYRICFRHDLAGDRPRILQMIAASDVLIADFTPAPNSGHAPDPDVVTDAAAARIGSRPRPVLTLHKESARSLPFNWRQLLKIGGGRPVAVNEGYEKAIRDIGGWLGQLCTQPPPPPPPPRKFKGSWDVCVSQSFQRANPKLKGSAGYDFAEFYKAMRVATDRLKGGPKVRLALFPKDQDDVKVWHRVQAGISRCALLIAEFSPDAQTGKVSTPDVLIEAALAGFQYDVPIVAAIHDDAQLPESWSHLEVVRYKRDDTEGLIAAMAERLQEILPEASRSERSGSNVMTYDKAVARGFGNGGHDVTSTPTLGVPRPDSRIIRAPGSVRATQSMPRAVVAMAPSTAAAGPFERFRDALDRRDYAAATDFYNEAVSLDPWQHALFNPDRFTVVQVLGAGTFGAVFHAKMAADDDDPREQEVVIKALLHPERLGIDPDQLFANMDLLRQAPRQGLVPIMDWDRYPRGEPNAWWHFWTPYDPRERSLQSLIDSKGPLNERDTMGIGAGIVMGLMSAHLFNLPHLALRPSNVIVRREGQKWAVALRDFGFAPDFAWDPGENPWMLPMLEWASPEQKHEVPLTPGLTSDVYQLGLLLV